MANQYTDNKDLSFHLHHPVMKRIAEMKEDNFAEKDEFDYAPRDHEDAIDNYEKTLEVIGEICGEIIEPNAEGVDQVGPKLENNQVIYAPGTKENLDALIQADVYGMSLPRKYGGLNFPIVPYVMANEMVSRADGGFANIWGLQDCAETIHEFGDEDIKNEFLPRINKGATASMDLTEPDSGSDLQSVQLKATYDEKSGKWILNGVKRFITNGDSDIALVLARSEEGTHDGRGLSLFVYDKKDGGLIVRRIENKMGIKGSPTCELVFKDAPAKLVGSQRMGLIKYVMSLMNSARLGIAAQSVGISEAAWREAEKYAKERIQFGKSIIEFPAVYEMLKNMKVKTQAQRTLMYETARFVDMYKAFSHLSGTRSLTPEERKEMKYFQRLADVYTPLVKLISSEYVNQITYDSLQVHGGAGYMKDFPIEKMYRDARITSIYEGTSQLQVVAAIRGVSTNTFLNKIKEYEAEKIQPEYEHLHRLLKQMTKEFETTVNAVLEVKDNEYYDFHARRLVEMAGNIIIGYLLIFDSQRDSTYKQSAEIFTKKAFAENKEKAAYIDSTELNDIGMYRQ
jgi:hypothetical protein